MGRGQWPRFSEGRSFGANVFDFEKGPDIVNTFHKVTNVLGNESKEVPPDLTAEAIYAKAATDFVGLKNGQQKF